MEYAISPRVPVNCTHNPVPPSPQPHLETLMCLRRTLTLDLAPASAHASSIMTNALKLNEKWAQNG